jgi:hypothetical protein
LPVADPGDQRRGFVRLGGIDAGVLHGWQATRQLDEIEAAVGSVTPEPERVAGPLERLTRLLVAAGPMAAAVGRLQTLAAWLGQARRRSVGAPARTRLNLMP